MTIKQQFNRMRKLSIQAKKEHDLFDEMVLEKYGVHYSDIDADQIIDEVDQCPTNPDYTFDDFDSDMIDAMESAGMGDDKK